MIAEDRLPDAFRAFVAHRVGNHVDAAVLDVGRAFLPPGDVTIKVAWSGVNYKDALAVSAGARVARINPLIPGTDLAGRVVSSFDGRHPVGSEVFAHGHKIGTAHHGGFSEFARLPGEWVLPLPAGLSGRQVMELGTAGFTAARSIDILERRGLTPSAGPVLVTGVSGGVGGYAVDMLLVRGYEVWAVTRTQDARAELTARGVRGFIGRDELHGSGRALEPERWAAAVDAVGRGTLPYILRSLRYGAAVAASGNVSGAQLVTTVYPFILRDVSLLGVDTAEVGDAERAAIWRRLATDLRPPALGERLREVDLAGVAQALASVRAGEARGRYLVRIGP